MLRARCRSCGEPISARYPTVELLVGVLALAISVRFGFTAASVGYFALAAALVALAYIDLDTWLLPNQITFPLLALGLLSPFWNGARVSFAESAIGAAAGLAFFGAIALVGEKLLHRETMGWGDVVLLGGIGAWLGWQPLLPVVMLSALQGSVVGLLMLAAGRDLAKRGQEESAQKSAGEDDWTPPPHAVPYGPFLALAALQWLLLGDLLTRLYDDFLRRLWS